MSTDPMADDQMSVDERIAQIAFAVGELITDVAELNGTLAELHRRLWHLAHDTDPGTELGN